MAGQMADADKPIKRRHRCPPRRRGLLL
jgi:hypothetical protein